MKLLKKACKSSLPYVMFLTIAGTGIFTAGQVISINATHAQAVKSAIDIVTPAFKQEITTLPVQVQIVFTGSMDSSTFRAKLNGKDISSKFVVTDQGATASLGVADGINPSKTNNIYQIFAQIRSKESKTNYTDIQVFSVKKQSPITGTETVADIQPTGGEVSLPQYGKITFPSGSFPTVQNVKLSATKSTETQTDYETTTAIFGATNRLPHELRVNSGSVRPATEFTATLVVPDSFLAQVPADSEIQVFAQIYQNGGEEVLDSFELFPSTYSATDKTVTVTLPPEAFTNLRNIEGTYEAVILLATTPTKPLSSSQTLSTLSSTTREQALPQPSDAVVNYSGNTLVRSLAANASVCEGATLGSPLAQRNVTSPFNPPSHKGTDYAAADGTDVLSMADGEIEKIGFDARPLPKPDPRSGKTVKGWGKYVIIKHKDDSRSLYAHLQDNGVAVIVGQPVTKGEKIASSDNSGGSSGPHLHVEYAPNGKIYDKASKVDPEPCINSNATGGITVRDNGSVADDAFTVLINGLQVCSTTIGASNTCAVGNLRSGTATLTIIANIAPDDVGTYEVTLSDGLTFSDGTTVRSSTLPQDGSASFPINIP